MDKERNSVEDFYDSLAEDYHLIFSNWDQAIQRQAQILDSLIKQYVKKEQPSIWDCTCGIGTQALGLAQVGYSVHGTDLSPQSIERATWEAKERELDHRYQITHFVLKGQDNSFDTAVRTTRYRAYRRQEITDLLIQAGLHDIHSIISYRK